MNIVNTICSSVLIMMMNVTNPHKGINTIFFTFSSYLSIDSKFRSNSIFSTDFLFYTNHTIRDAELDNGTIFTVVYNGIVIHSQTVTRLYEGDKW